MTETCKACGQLLLGKSAAKPENITINAPQKFSELCFLLARMGAVQEDEKFLSFIQDIPGKVRKYGSITIGQSKFFAVIHKKATGNWPPSWDEFQKEDPIQPNSKLPENESEIPF